MEAFMRADLLHWILGCIWPPSGSEGERDDNVTEVCHDGGTKTGGWRILIAHPSPVPFIPTLLHRFLGEVLPGPLLGPTYRLYVALGGNELWTYLVLLEVLTKLCAGSVCPLHTVGV